MKYISLKEYVVHFLVEWSFYKSPSVCLKNAMSKLHAKKKMNMWSCMGKSVTIGLLPLELRISVEYTERDIVSLMVTIVHVSTCECGKHRQHRILYGVK